jgi:excinuclease ABC subunit C
MCKQNAVLQLKELQLQKMKKDDYAPYTLSALQRDLRLKRLPRSIECFDISTLQGTDTVAGLVVFENGKPKKSRYRKFIIRDTVGQDDFASMNEAVKRRYKRAREEEEPLPDLIMVDGGKGQLSAAVKALTKLGIDDVPIVGLAKRLEEVFFPGASEPTALPRTSSSLKLLQQLRDEAHRFAITFHRKRREKRTFATELTEISGVGNKTADRLLKEMGSVRAVKEAELSVLAGVVGEKRARAIKEHFQGS